MLLLPKIYSPKSSYILFFVYLAMKLSKTTILVFVVMIVLASVYRVFDRPMGFAPQIALALAGGMLFKNRWIGLLLPLVSMILSDILYECLYMAGMSSIEGFYSGQWLNYILLGSVVFIGYLFKTRNWKSYIAAGIAGPTYYFLVSNFAVWASGSGFAFPKTFSGLMANYTVALPFYYNSIYATFFFGAIIVLAYNYAEKRAYALSNR